MPAPIDTTRVLITQTSSVPRDLNDADPLRVISGGKNGVVVSALGGDLLYASVDVGTRLVSGPWNTIASGSTANFPAATHTAITRAAGTGTVPIGVAWA